ncbi:MAG: alpha-L-fucosidase [Tepidisphaeraceae bacterium]
MTRLKQHWLTCAVGAAVAGLGLSGQTARADEPAKAPMVIVDTTQQPIAPGKFKPTWDSLKQYQTPEWFSKAKFGIWAHWGPQCQPEDGDWYARNMYIEGSGQYKDHLARYGHPSVAGFKDIIHEWKAEKFDPDRLLSLYKRAGAQYFFALGDHHDNFDLWNSKYQPWNATRIGPEKDLIAGWEKAVRANGLKFGVSIHAAHAWTWYEPAQGADKTGPKAGVPYDGKLTKADGKGTWWDGLDPQALYAQNHPRSASSNTGKIWDWGKDATPPDQAYCDKFYNRVADLISNYHPDLLYFDDTGLPLWPVSDAGLKIAADFYNTNLDRTQGKDQGVIFGKQLTPLQRQCLTLDIERGVSNKIEPEPWQTDTCIGDWHYQRARFTHHSYKSADTVIRMLCDIVSKNGNLLLNIPVRGDGTIDSDEEAIVNKIGDWMEVNKQAIFDTTPWEICGEGPAMSAAAPLHAQGFNEGKGKPLSADDVRFTVAPDGSLYAIILGWPTKPLTIAALGTAAKRLQQPIADVQVLGDGRKVEWKQEAGGLTLNLSSSDKAKDEKAPAVVCHVILK